MLTIHHRRCIALAGLLTACVTIASPVMAEDDEQPSTVEDNAGSGYYVMRNAKGERTGTLEEEGAGYLVQRDTKGRRTGTMELESAGNQWIVRDTAGRRVGTIDQH